MARFVNRKDELKALEEEYRKNDSSLVILYGRRRVGKTTLLTEFLKQKKSLFYLATEESETLNRAAFQLIVAEGLDIPLLKSAIIDRWEDIFQEIADNASDERLVLVLDEFQYLGKANPAFPSIFQRIWDTILKEKNVMVVLCGSLISMMVSQTLSYDSPLYGRRTSQIKLQQIPFDHYQEFYGRMGKRQLVEYYSVTGGVPKYIEALKQQKSLTEAIRTQVVNKNSFLFDEPTFLLQKEVTEIGSYFSIISAIAAGSHRISELAGTLQVKQTNLSKYLNVLIDLDLVKREVPITEKNPEKSKKGLYFLKDNFLTFWFRFIQPNRSYIESGHPEYAMRKIEESFIENHVAFVYEDICRENMWTLAVQGTWLFSFSKIGRWWNKSSEIDIVALDEEGNNIVFGECKFWKSKVGINVLLDLEQKAQSVEWGTEARQEHYALFSISGFTKDLEELAKKRDDILLFS